MYITYEVLDTTTNDLKISNEMYHKGDKYSFLSMYATSSLEIIATKESEISIEFPGEQYIEWECIRLHPVENDIYAINRLIPQICTSTPKTMYKFVIMLKYKPSYVLEPSLTSAIVPDRCRNKMINFCIIKKTPIITVSNGTMQHLYQNRWMLYETNGMQKFST
jgi:hypothetical protein